MDFNITFFTTVMKINLREVGELIAQARALKAEKLILQFVISSSREEIEKSEDILGTTIYTNVADP